MFTNVKSWKKPSSPPMCIWYDKCPRLKDSNKTVNVLWHRPTCVSYLILMRKSTKEWNVTDATSNTYIHALVFVFEYFYFLPIPTYSNIFRRTMAPYATHHQHQKNEITIYPLLNDIARLLPLVFLQSSFSVMSKFTAELNPHQQKGWKHNSIQWHFHTFIHFTFFFAWGNRLCTIKPQLIYYITFHEKRGGH